MKGIRRQPRYAELAAQLDAEGNRSRVEQDARSRFAFQAGIHGIAEPLVDGAFLEAAGF